MPIWKRKRVQFIQPSDELLDWARNSPSKPVFVLRQTGEIFTDYKSYSARLSFYRTKHFQCEVTGKGGLDYFQAIESELQEARNLQARFPESLKKAVLRAVQWQIIGRLDNLVDAVFERFKERFFSEEKVLLDIKGDKYWARVLSTHIPKSSSSSEPHYAGGDLRLDNEQACQADPPDQYIYNIQILEEVTAAAASTQTAPRPEDGSTKWSGSIMEVHCKIMSRDRLTFSKSLLRKFLRDSVDRESTVASPWIVKPALARLHGLDTVMPEETKRGIEDCRKGESEKRKKAWEDKDGPPSKKQKKTSEVKGQDSVPDPDKQDAELKKKKPIKYPIEDLDVERTEKDKKSALKSRPLPRTEVPFGEYFEPFFMSWCYLQTFGTPLNLSPFTLQQYEHAINHADEDACFLMAEIHTCLAYNIRQVPGQRNTASTSLYEASQEHDGLNDGLKITTEELLNALATRGGNWERAPLRNTPDREGWQDAIVGLLKDHASPRSFPRLRHVLVDLLFHPALKDMEGSFDSPHAFLAASYNAMPAIDKISLVAFLCDRSVSSKSVRSFMENCDERLTTLRKEKTEINRERKRCLEQMQELSGDVRLQSATPGGEGDETTPVAAGNKYESEDEKEPRAPSESENGTRSSRSTPGTGGKIGKSIKLKVPGLAQQRKAERERVAQEKAAAAESRRLEEELVKLDGRLRAADLEFRSVMTATRTRPIGKDRFFYRYWWLDGLGGTACSTGRIYVQSPSELDQEVLEKREIAGEGIHAKMQQELGDSFLGQSSPQWGYYSTPEELDELLASLIHKGKRELHLRNAINLWKPQILADFEKRLFNSSHVNVPRASDSRRSSRHNATEKDVTREGYLNWTNRRAPNASGTTI